MGGNALKEVQTLRLEKSDYENVKHKIAELLTPHIKIEFLYEVPNKKDFGDLDILYDISENQNHIIIYDLVKELFHPKEIVKNGTVLSFSYLINEENDTYFQIDLIKSHNFHMDLFYYSYGDLGGILGRITKYYGLSYGNPGLWINNIEDHIIEKYLEKNIKYDKNNDDSLLLPETQRVFKGVVSKSINGKIMLTENPEEICVYMGLDYEKWSSGFNNSEEIYDFVIKSHLFKSKLFEVNSLNSEHMRRYNERPMYREFIDYVNLQNNKKEEKEINKSKDYDYEALIYFDKINELEKLIEKNILQNERKEKFNGHIIQEYIKRDFKKNTNKIGENKELGIFIINFKNHILKNGNLYNTFEDYIDNNNKEKIEEDIIDFYNM
jgi:hypothetical protein